MVSVIKSASIIGMDVCFVDVEIDVTDGLPSFQMVGSLSNKTKEAKERVNVALKNSGYEFPPAKVTVNISPAELRKDGSVFDLAIAVGLLEDFDVVKNVSQRNIIFMGELGLLGEIKKINGVLPIVRAAKEAGYSEVIVPKENVSEGALIPGINVRGAESIADIVAFLYSDEGNCESILPKAHIDAERIFKAGRRANKYDFEDVRGQIMAKRAALISAAGFHNLLLVGPPGAGKSMIAKRIPGIMPELTLDESLEVTSVYSVAGKMDGGSGLIATRPFQSPHHSASMASLTGGGSIPRPGMISLAHRGVLFLDELPEFTRSVLDSLRGPIEEKMVHVTRVGGDVIFPSDFILVAAMNPCPCGYFPDRERCKCPESKVRGYMGKISGPILDRIDLCVEMGGVAAENLKSETSAMNTQNMRKLVERARSMQAERFHGTSYRFNSDIEAADFDRFCPLDEEGRSFLENVYKKLGLSVRSYHRIIRVARTIADLKADKYIRKTHLAEAVSFRPSREFWS